jgi:hypothetical protein
MQLEFGTECDFPCAAEKCVRGSDMVRITGMKLVTWMIALAGLPALAQTPGIDEIMAKVAANQKKSVEARKQYVYHQEMLVGLHRTNGKLARQETRQYTVTPDASSGQKQMTGFGGKYEDHGKVGTYDKPGYESKGLDIDGALVSAFADDKDGDIPRDLFPLTKRAQRQYTYTIEGVEMYHERHVYRISFRPNHERDKDGDQGAWKGSALIDAEEFQPLRVTTDLAWKVPLAVRTVLGTNVRGVGFTVTYERMADGVWFPASFGGEFEVRAVFFYKRNISLNLKNSDFRHTEVVSKVAFDIDRP